LEVVLRINLEAASEEPKSPMGTRYIQQDIKATRPEGVGIEEEAKGNIWLGDDSHILNSTVSPEDPEPRNG
jgi:hypothetical protein